MPAVVGAFSQEPCTRPPQSAGSGYVTSTGARTSKRVFGAGGAFAHCVSARPVPDDVAFPAAG